MTLAAPLKIALAVFVQTAAGQGSQPPGSFESWRVSRSTSPELQFSMSVVGKAIEGRPARILIGIRNVSQRTLRFALDEHWLYEVSGGRTVRPGQGEGGGRLLGKPTSATAGKTMCPRVGTVHVLPGNSEMWRDTEVLLDVVGVGEVRLEVGLRLLKVAEDLACRPADYYLGTAKAQIRIHPRAQRWQRLPKAPGEKNALPG